MLVMCESGAIKKQSLIFGRACRKQISRNVLDLHLLLDCAIAFSHLPLPTTLLHVHKYALAHHTR